MNAGEDILTLFTLPLDVIWKHEMGERYCTWARLVGLTVFMWFVMTVMMFLFYNHPTALSPKTPKIVQAVVGLVGFYGLPAAMWILGAKNIAEINRRKKSGPQVHSFFMGKPRFLPDNEIVHRLIIPLGSILAGALLVPLVTFTGVYIIFMGVCQFLLYSDIRSDRKVYEMNQADRKLEREWKIAELTGGRGHPEGVVRVAETRHRSKATEQNDFDERWRSVLHPQPPADHN